MDIVYGGVQLTMCSLEEMGQDAVFDPSGTDYLFTRNRIVGTFVVNGQAEVRPAGPPVSYTRTNNPVIADASWTFGAPPDLETLNYNRESVNLDAFPKGVVTTPFAAGGAPPKGIYARQSSDLIYFAIEPVANTVPRTFAAIRHRLMVPRQPLYVFANTGSLFRGDILIRSPLQENMHCDAMNGPKPLFCDTLWSAGEADTHLVRFGIETYVNESQDNVTPPSRGTPFKRYLLSNRFSMRHVVTEDQITVIEVQGEAYFRTDFEYFDSVSPDDLRLQLFLPVPFGFVRQDISVEGMPGANGVRYFFRDRQQSIHFPAGPFAGATRIEAQHTQTLFTDTDLLKAVAEITERTTSTILNNRWLANSLKAGDAAGKPGTTGGGTP